MNRPPEWAVAATVAAFGLIVWGVAAWLGAGQTVLSVELFVLAVWAVREVALWAAAKIHYRRAWERLRRNQLSEEGE